MKRILLFALILLAPLSFVFGQKSLPDSRQSSAKLFVYRLDNKDVRDLYIKDKNLEESMLHTFVISCAEAKDIPVLPRGNYITVRVIGNQLAYSDHTVDNLRHWIVRDENVMLLLTDTLGNAIGNATVKCGAKRLRFDQATQTYNTSNITDEKIIEVDNDGVLHFIEFNAPQNRVPRGYYLRKNWRKIKNGFNTVFAPEKARRPDKYDGFVVFNKPKYKPGETVKFKAHIYNLNNKPYNDEVDVRLYSYSRTKIDTTLTTLKPYRPGMYEWEFKLTDSLNLRLDSYFNIVLKTKGKRANNISGSFDFEEYELKRITFEAQADRKTYVKGDSVKIQLSAEDENGMPIYDGRVEIVVRPLSSSVEYVSKNIFVPTETWKHTVDLAGKALEDIVLPDSAFVDNAAMRYFVGCTFFDAGNEKHVKEPFFNLDRRERIIKFSTDKGILTIEKMADGESVATKALLTAYDEDNDVLYSDSIMLPYSKPVEWYVYKYNVTTETLSVEYGAYNAEDIIGYQFFREDGQVRLVVDNPARLPFWYTVCEGKNVIDKGYATALDRSYKGREKSGYSMQISYLLGGRDRTIDGSLPYSRKNISMEVKTSPLVYPGQTTSVDVSVKDKRGRPVKNVDITAYAYATKFDKKSPKMTVFGKSAYGKHFDNSNYYTDNVAPSDSKSPMDWEIWRERMGLDSIEYYKFLYPEKYYSYSAPVVGMGTQIAPYVVIDGEPQGVHVLWIDDLPHYFEQAKQFNVYSFPVARGYHTLRMHTYDREITIKNVFVREGEKTIISVNGENSATLPIFVPGVGARPMQITVKEYEKEEIETLSESEMEVLKEHMITVDNTFTRAIMPNIRGSIEMPAMIGAAGLYYSLNGYGTQFREAKSVLVGPFPYDRIAATGGIGMLYVDTTFVEKFSIEGGYRYGIWKDYVKQTSWEQTPFTSQIKRFTPKVSFTQTALTQELLSNNYHQSLLGKAEGERGHVFPARMDERNGCTLKLETGVFDVKNAKPVLIRLASVGRTPSFKYLYYGATRNFEKLAAGSYQVDLVFRDTVRYSAQVTLRPNGTNYLKMDSTNRVGVDNIGREVFNALNSNIKISTPQSPAQWEREVEEATRFFKQANLDANVVTGTVNDDFGGIPGATVSIEDANGRTIGGVTTDINGRFRLPVTAQGNLVVSYIGCYSFTTKLVPGSEYTITLKLAANDKTGPVIIKGVESNSLGSDGGAIGYATEKSFGSASAVSVEDMLAGKIAGMDVIRGGGMGGENKIRGGDPLIIVNGRPYEGALSDLKSGDIIFMNVKQDADPAIYGPNAAFGVIFITTKAGTHNAPIDPLEFPDGWENAKALRINFHDDAFWRPRLSTGKDGSVSFDVTYPDDITSWNANFIAVGGRKQTDKAQLNIRSFKPLNAQLSLPQFVVEGDSLNAIGRLTNHLGDSVKVERSIELQGYTSKENISFSTSHVDNIPVIVTEEDSIGITYSLDMENGYADGEQRKIPVYMAGIMETHGEFALLSDTLVHRFATDSTLGKVTVHAEASGVKSFMDEIERIDRYAYMCNEQMASKLKALLMKKRICAMLGTDFKEDKKINDLIGKIEKNRNDDYLWGWWNKSSTELWISRQVIEALLDAQAAGYKITSTREAFINSLARELESRQSRSPDAVEDNFAKHDMLDLIGLLGKVKANDNYSRQTFDNLRSMPDATLNDRLRCMEIAMWLDANYKPDAALLLSLASKTMMGSIYWSEKEKPGVRPWRFLSPNVNNITNTLSAYRILKAIGGHEKELEQIRNYFFEMRKDGSWQNIYESSRIMETIIPDMLGASGTFAEPALAINGKRFEKFPVTVEFKAGESIEAKKEGPAPVFITVYQQAWNSAPKSVSEGFTIKTAFYEKNEPVASLKAGQSVDLKVTVTLDSDARYVMIEVPIPAGCSYESKSRGGLLRETHREYHKEKVAIFCTGLPKGTHDFVIKLIPRFTGLYNVNPPKVELMYFPVFFGRGEMQVREID